MATLTKVLYRSTDDGAFYREEEVDAESVADGSYERWEVDYEFTLRADDLCGPNDAGELLVRTNHGRRL